jgi:hypothetical protein
MIAMEECIADVFIDFTVISNYVQSMCYHIEQRRQHSQAALDRVRPSDGATCMTQTESPM